MNQHKEKNIEMRTNDNKAGSMTATQVLTNHELECLWSQHAEIAKPGERRIAFGRAVEAAILARRIESTGAKQVGELTIGVSNNDRGVHINIIQRHVDGTATLIYAARAPEGDSFGQASLASKTTI